MQPFIGQIALFPFNFAPRGWALCRGQLLPVSQNTALFDLLRTYYGGDGKTNFALPNLQDRVPIGAGQAPGMGSYTLGDEGGAATVSLTSDQNAPHNHSLNATTDYGTSVKASGNQLAQPLSGTRTSTNTGLIYSSTSNPNTSLARNAIGNTGSSQPHNNIQPYQCLSYCIALQGVFPPRS